ncbi:MAG: sigma-54-dependent Fis family transcriptional regulator [Deltaproteobacteria bacterium]|nr:sigma-54-dependent Fis family transcriptional regulator [Deltaproteobacteria bacterium]
MAKTIRLSPHDRDFFDLVSRRAFCNPFSDERIALDCRIAECPSQVTVGVPIEQVFNKVRKRIQCLEIDGRAGIRQFQGEERSTMEGVFLFYIFHQFSKEFDKLIITQFAEGDDPCAVPFARDILNMLVSRGFYVQESHRFLAMIYQLQRAYYFIEQSLVGEAPCMKQLRLRLWNNVFTYDIRWYGKYLWDRMEDFSTLFLGETGTGKGAAAAAIGRSGFIPYNAKKECFTESFVRNFISINLSLYPESLIESELFGHKKGAFTGAIEQHQGIFSRCSPHGSIFLDEIGDVSVPIQLKLLQILQERTFSPVGSHKRLRFNGRVIAATNKPLTELRKKGVIRDDFYYRLCSDCILVPPLRQRIRENPGELDIMLAHLLFRMIGEESNELTQMVCHEIRNSMGFDYSWPGNVRELEQAVRRILLTKEYKVDHARVSSSLQNKLLSGIEAGELSAQELLNTYCTLLYERFGTYEKVARITNLDRRTVKRYVELSGK